MQWQPHRGEKSCKVPQHAQPQQEQHDHDKDSRHEKDHEKDYQVDEDSGKIDDEDVYGKDVCDQTDVDKQYRGEDRTAARTDATRWTATRSNVVWQTGPR